MDVKAMIADLSETVRENANVDVVFGEPIEQKGLTLVPVAKISIKGGGGGGGGQSEDQSESGSGLGMGLSINTVPLGYIEIRDGEATFHEIIDRSRLALAMVIAAGVVGLFVARGMRS